MAQTQADSVPTKAKRVRDWKLSDYLQIHGFVDAQYDYTLQPDDNGGMEKHSVIMLRRARFDFSGKLHPMLDFRLQADMAFTPRLLDAWLRVKFCKYAHLWIGQLKTPYTMDNFLSPLDLEFVELSQSVAALAGFSDISGIAAYANGLEIGAMLSGTLVDIERDGERLPILNYYAGIFGGAGINIRKDNLSKDFAARLDFYPFVKNFRLSGSVYIGNYSLFPDKNAPRHRYSGGMEYLGEHWTARAEYLQGTTGVADDSPLAAEDAIYLVNTRGMYAFVGYGSRWGGGVRTRPCNGCARCSVTTIMSATCRSPSPTTTTRSTWSGGRRNMCGSTSTIPCGSVPTGSGSGTFLRRRFPCAFD